MSWVDSFRNIPGFSGDLFFDEPLSKHTYFKIGGPAKVLAVPKTIEDLVLLRERIENGIPAVFLLGLGSNLLVRDIGLDALCIKTTRLPGGVVDEKDGIRVGAGVPVAQFLRRAADSGWDGFESISGIPGTMGGVVAMNGGTHLGEIGKLVLEVRAFELDSRRIDLKVYSPADLKFSYRKNLFLGPHEIIVDTLYRKTFGDSAAIRQKLDSLYRRRKETQPLDFPSCGSVFKNPDASTLRAWEVIDRLGLRGHRIGNAQIAEKHPNWILNLGEARAEDVLALINLAKVRAKAELGIDLVEEVRIL